ncbi:MAG TPA: diguanylate cyclase [Gemmatimonadaceae bacterium]|nr:diguanylate cyclase [Gemmatimonadaceae bacterium]
MIRRPLTLGSSLVTLLAAAKLGAQDPAAVHPIRAVLSTDVGNTPVTIAGRATAAVGQMQRSAFEVAVQDSSGGVRVFSRTVDARVREGDSVVATGTIKRYRGDLELVATRVTVVPAAPRVIAPRDVPIDVSVISRYPGQLVRVRGRVDAFGYSEGGQWLRLRDSATARGTITIWVPANHGAPIDLSRARPDDSLTVAGIVTSYQDNADDPVVWQLVPRTKTDVVVSATSATWPTWLLGSLLGAGIVVLAVLARARLNSRRQLRALRETDARYRQLLAMSPEAVLVHTGGKVVFTNPAAAELLGVASEQALVGRAIGDFAAPESRDALEGLSTNPHGGRPPRVRGRLLKSTGTPLDVEISSSPCLYHDQPAVVVLARDISGQLRHERDLQALALVDELTGLHNRRGFTLFADQEIARARRSGRMPTLVFADLDDLKGINDVHGHASGDAAIRLVATAFKSILRESDIVARWSGDEFVALLSDGDASVAEQIGDRLAAAIASQAPSQLPYVVSATVGTSALDPMLSFGDAIERADAELYTRKRRARRGRTSEVANVDAGSERE